MAIAPQFVPSAKYTEVNASSINELFSIITPLLEAEGWTVISDSSGYSLKPFDSDDSFRINTDVGTDTHEFVSNSQYRYFQISGLIEVFYGSHHLLCAVKGDFNMSWFAIFGASKWPREGFEWIAGASFQVIGSASGIPLAQLGGFGTGFSAYRLRYFSTCLGTASDNRYITQRTLKNDIPAWPIWLSEGDRLTGRMVNMVTTGDVLDNSSVMPGGTFKSPISEDVVGIFKSFNSNTLLVVSTAHPLNILIRIADEPRTD